MKKYVIAYLVLFLILLGLGLTHGIPFGITVAVRDEIYGFNPHTTREIILIYNIIIIFACFMSTVILTKRKENVLKCKWLIPVIMFICFAFLPMGMSEIIPVVGRNNEKIFWSIFSYIIYWYT